MRGHVTLIGYRASGKSTVGRLLAARLGLPFVDADRALEQRLGTSIAALFAGAGETVFRDHETRLLEELLAGPAGVLATGGGVVLRTQNRAVLAARGGTVVYLDAPAALVQTRLRADAGGRPSLSGGNVADEAPRLLAERDSLYREVATLIVDATRPATEIAATIADAVENLGRKPVE